MENLRLEKESLERVKEDLLWLTGAGNAMAEYKKRMCHNALETIDALLHRLAAYENTGMEPEDLRSNEDIDFARVVELLRADAEGRLVTVPCKAGDRVWINCILGYDRCEEHEITSVEVNIGAKIGLWFNAEMVGYRGAARCSFGGDQIGKTVFLTREEAEAALQKEETP